MTPLCSGLLGSFRGPALFLAPSGRGSDSRPRRKRILRALLPLPRTFPVDLQLLLRIACPDTTDLRIVVILPCFAMLATGGVCHPPGAQSGTASSEKTKS